MSCHPLAVHPNHLARPPNHIAGVKARSRWLRGLVEGLSTRSRGHRGFEVLFMFLGWVFRLFSWVKLNFFCYLLFFFYSFPNYRLVPFVSFVSFYFLLFFSSVFLYLLLSFGIFLPFLLIFLLVSVTIFLGLS